MNEFLRSFWLVDLGSWAFFLLLSLGFGRWAASKGLSGRQAFRHGAVATGLTLFLFEVALAASFTGPLWPMKDYQVELWCTLILPRIGLWSVIGGLLTLTISGARIRNKPPAAA